MSGRTAVIALVLSALALSYAYPVRTYLEQRAEINRLRDSQGEQAQRIAELEAERAKWDDPAYVKAQARERLLLVEPGEELIIIVDDKPDKGDKDSGPSKSSKDPWFDDLWESFDNADNSG
ncbi:Septum formation initiator [Stackebrandtia nassauensis DSM 44728]|uniref:Septum formation initiator n=2 Tax=Stackebrandtia TaxID=283810 RepID=D3PZ21_STANL|nr:Septum formation initiator [Stackebrandtia nassauensis DSM 44728]